MGKKLLIFLDIFLFLILLTEIILIALFFTKEKPKQAAIRNSSSRNITSSNITAKVSSTPAPDESDVPLNKDFSWEQILPSDSRSLFNPYQKSFLYADSETINTNFAGKDWKTEKANLTSGELELAKKNLKDYYNSYFNSAGWKDSLDIQGVRIQTIAADGPTGSVWGYIKHDGDSIRFVLMSESTVLPGEKLKEACPCSYIYELFLSDPIPVGEFLKH